MKLFQVNSRVFLLLLFGTITLSVAGCATDLRDFKLEKINYQEQGVFFGRVEVFQQGKPVKDCRLVISEDRARKMGNAYYAGRTHTVELSFNRVVYGALPVGTAYIKRLECTRKSLFSSSRLTAYLNKNLIDGSPLTIHPDGIKSYIGDIKIEFAEANFTFSEELQGKRHKAIPVTITYQNNQSRTLRAYQIDKKDFSSSEIRNSFLY